MRLLVIACLVVGAVFMAWKGFGNIIHPPDRKSFTEAAGAAPAAPVAPPIPPAPVEPPAAPGVVKGVIPPGEIKIEAVGVYTFKNRPVPPAPFGRTGENISSSTDRKGLELSVDAGSNSWIMRGSPDAVEEIKRIAGFIDLVQDELDLDFCLIAVSAEWLARVGISAAYQAGASWLDAFTLGGEGATLRLSSGNFTVNIDAELADSSMRLVSAPVVRCITGEPWEFSADEKVPVATLERSEGVVSTAYQYQDVGLGFTGNIVRAGPSGSYRLTVKQRNGSVVGEATEGVPPNIKNQVLESALVVQVGRWSCLGGVTSWKAEKSRRLLGFSNAENQELLLVFIRARDMLKVAPTAYPVGNPPARLPGWSVEPWDLGPDAHPLLPSKGWTKESLDSEIRRVEADIRAKMGRPGNH